MFQTIQALSGFQSIDETVSNLNIRGGTHDQNLILWDDIKMYQSGHFFGLISAINPRIAKKVSLLKNGTPAFYSDGVSGTVDMKTDNAITENLTTEVGLNFINADAFVDIPLYKKSSLQIAARKSFSEYLNTPTYSQYFDRAFQNTDILTSTSSSNSTNEKFNFYDISARWLTKLSEKDQLRINFLNLNNTLSFSENTFGGGLLATRESTLDQKNLAGGIYYERRWDDRLMTAANITGSNYKLDAANFDIVREQLLEQQNEITEFGANINATYLLSDQVILKGGYHFIETQIINAEKINFPAIDTVVTEVVQKHALSSEITYGTKDQKMHVKFGTRFNYINTFDTFLIEPRLSFHYKLNDKYTLEVLGEFKNQTTTLITDFGNTFLGIERRRWSLSNDDDIPILNSKQISVSSNYNHEDLMINAEIYYKRVNGITTQSQGFQNQYEFIASNGSYNVKGFDFIINNKFGKFNTWVNYSLADNNYVFKDLADTRFPNNIDIRHTVSIASAYELENLQLSAGLNWRTGKPATQPIEGNEISNGIINYEPANNRNLDAYMRFDVSAIYDFKLTKKVKAQAGLSVLNLFNQKNIINQYYQINDDNEAEQIQEFSLGITPNLAFRVFF